MHLEKKARKNRVQNGQRQQSGSGTTLAMVAGMSPRRELFMHLARVGGAALLLALTGSSWLAPIASASLFLATFSLAHDLVHGALGLRGRASRIALTLAGWSFLSSGHGMQRTHLHHHRRPLADDDYEGVAARMSFLRACVMSIPLSLALRGHALSRGRCSRRARIALETLVSLALFAAMVISPYEALRVHALIVVAAQLTMPIWAGYLSHRTPEWLARAMRSLAFTGSPTVLALAFHDVHHRHPKTPCRRLARAPA